MRRCLRVTRGSDRDRGARQQLKPAWPRASLASSTASEARGWPRPAPRKEPAWPRASRPGAGLAARFASGPASRPDSPSRPATRFERRPLSAPRPPAAAAAASQPAPGSCARTLRARSGGGSGGPSTHPSAAVSAPAGRDRDRRETVIEVTDGRSRSAGLHQPDGGGAAQGAVRVRPHGSPRPNRRASSHGLSY